MRKIVRLFGWVASLDLDETWNLHTGYVLIGKVLLSFNEHFFIRLQYHLSNPKSVNHILTNWNPWF